MATIEYQIVDLGDSKNPCSDTRLIQVIETKVTPKVIVCLQLGKLRTPGSLVNFLPEGSTGCMHHKCKLVSLAEGEALENHQNEWTSGSMERMVQERV